MLICSVAHADHTGRRGMLASRWAVRLGEWSFAFYMSHQLVLRLVDWLWPGSSWPLLQAAVDLVLALAACAMLFRCVERPAERLLRPSSRVRPAAAWLSGVTAQRGDEPLLER